MSILSQHIDNLLRLDRQTIGALALICAVAAFFIKDRLRHPPFVIFLYPLLLVFSILTEYLFLQVQLFMPNKLDEWLMWTLIASICGILLGTGLVAAAASLGDRSGGPEA